MRSRLQELGKKPLDDRFGFLLYRTAYLLKKTMYCNEKHEFTDSIPTEEHEVLCWIFELERVSPKVLVQLTFKDKTTVSRLVKSLLKKELIISETHPLDGRQIELFPTKKGCQFMEKFVAYAEGFQNIVMEGIEPGEIEKAMFTLRRVFNNLSNLERGGENNA